MADPFTQVDSRSQLVREAKVGLSVVMAVIVVAVYWSLHRYNKTYHQVPDHVRKAPIAKHVGPDTYLSHLDGDSESENGSASSIAVTDNPQKLISHRQQTDVSQTAETVSYETEEEVRSTQNRQRKNPASPDCDCSITAASQTSVLVSLTEKIDRLEKITETLVESKSRADGYAERSELLPVNVSINPVEQAATRDISTSLPIYQQNDGPNSNDSSRRKEPEVREFVPKRPKAIDPSLKDFQTSRVDRDERIESASYEKQVSFDNVDQPTIPIEISDPTDKEQVGSNDAELPLPVQEIETNHMELEDGHCYQTQTGDSFWTIAQKKYEDGRYFRALFEHNRSSINDFERLPLNTVLKTPSLEFLKTQYPELCPSDQISSPGTAMMYTTHDGDTLFDIARRSTGQASRYLEVMKLNQDRLPTGVNHLTRLPADIVLRMPD